MSIFVYSPSIRMLIEQSATNNTIDVSEDITQGQVQLRENGLHTMSIGLLNKRRKYDRAFSPNDRFVIYMKRTVEMLVMTGYLNVVPFVTAWQRTITLTGSCANKRLLYHYWDPGLQSVLDLLSKNGNLGDPAAGADGGIGAKLNAVLNQVCGMNEAQIHIGQIPTEWMRKIAALYNSVESTIGNNYWSSLGGANTNGNTPTAPSTNAGNVIGVATLPNTPPGAELPTTMGAVTAKPPLTTGVQKERDIYWIAMQWGFRMPPDGNYNTPGIDKVKAGNWLAKQKLIVTNGDNNVSAVVYVTGWGPSYPAADPVSTSIPGHPGKGETPDPVAAVPNPASMCLSASLMKKMGLAEGQDAMVAWVNPSLASKTNFGLMTAAQVQAESQWNPSNTYSAAIQGQVETVSVAGVNAANWASAKCTANPPIPYATGGVGPNGYDCSGLTSQAWLNGGKIQIPRTSEDQYKALHANVANLTEAQLQPGDLIFYQGEGYPPPGHVTMWLGGGNMAEAPTSGQNLHVTPYRTDGLMGYGRPSNADAIAGTTNIPVGSTADAAGTAAATGASLLTEWDWFGQGPDPISMILTGVRSLMNDQPILPFIDMLVKTSMRSWCSAPNGDFIAWFPDFFGVYGTAGVMEIQAIELQDFTMVWSDENLVTHQFTAGTYAPTVFGPSPGGPVGVGNMAQTMGIATVDSPQILQALFNLSPADMAPGGKGTNLSNQLRARFGVRPNFQPMQAVVGHLAEFWFALYLFQQAWASQFNTVIPITFMPELYPGMLIKLPEFNFQCYVTGVNHSFNLTQGGGFTTEAYVIAPSSTKGSHGLYGLVKGGLGGLVG
jgi:cell wall-associated NlpC family hydrolase